MASVVGSPTSLLQVLSAGIAIPVSEWDKLLPQLTLFCALLTCLLPTVDDVEFYETNYESKSSNFSSMPFMLNELRAMTLIMRDVCVGLIELAYHDTKLGVRSEYKQALKSVRDDTSNSDESSIRVWLKLFKNSVHVRIFALLSKCSKLNSFCVCLYNILVAPPVAQS